MKKIAFTIVLNGMPFLKQQAEYIPQTFDEWHIIEGATKPVKDTDWCKNIKYNFYNQQIGEYKGCSVDGTSEYIDQLCKKYNNVIVHRKGDLWEGKTEMCNSISHVMTDCILMQIDVDEIWSRSTLLDIFSFVETNPDFNSMSFRCDYYYGHDIKIIYEKPSKNLSWKRLWKITEKTTWKTHEPPCVYGESVNIDADFTKNRGWIFDHFAYTTKEQLAFKENFYGYKNATKQWEALQNNTVFPCKLRNFLNWVGDDVIVDKIKMNDYIIYTGFVKDINPQKYGNLSSDEFFNVWMNNTKKFYPNSEIKLIGPDIPDNIVKYGITQYNTYPNLGHVEDYVRGNRRGRWCGWTAGIIIGLMDAYVNNKDFLYKEQDCLAYGNYIEQMYNDIKDGGIVYGSCKLMGPAQSLFLVRRDFIPDMIKSLADDDDSVVLPEYKFTRLPFKQNRLSFGYDRDRPVNISDKCWYIQQITPKELEILEQYNLIIR